jgi:hypothetical protein
MPNSIPEQQNSPRFLRLLRARQQLYRYCVRWQVTQIVLTVLVPFLGGLFGIAFTHFRPYVGGLALAIAILDVIWIDRSYRRALRTAATASEQFDCELLDMPWNKFAVGPRLGPEKIDAASRAWPKGDAGLLDWYPPVVGTGTLHQARIICQRANLWYDAELRRRYAGGLLGATAVLLGALLVAGFGAKLSLNDFVITVLTPAAPVVLWAFREALRQRDASDALEMVKGEAEALWARVVAGNCTSAECDELSREYQDAIFARRVANPLIFPLIYKLFRSKTEETMNAGAKELLREVGIET